MFKLRLHWYLLGTLLSRPYLLKHWFSNFSVHQESLSKQGLCWAPAHGFRFSRSGGGPSIRISNKLSSGCCWCWSGKHTSRTCPKEKDQSCSSGNIFAVSPLPDKPCELCAFFTPGEGLLTCPHFPGTSATKYFLGESKLPWGLTAEATVRTDLIHLRSTVTSRAQADHGQGCEDAQRGKEYISTSVIGIHLSEEVEAEVRIHCSKGGHRGTECHLSKMKTWNEFQGHFPSMSWVLYSFTF